MFGERLERARKATGLSLRALGEQVGVSQTAISKYEKDQLTPNSSMLLKLAKALDVKVEYFFRPKKFIFNLENVEYRKREITKKGLDLINAKILNQIEKRFELESFFPNSPVVKFSLSKNLNMKIQSMDDVDNLADQLRKEWKLGLNPIPELIDVLETYGIRVFSIDDSVDQKFDGLATNIQGQPIVVISSDWPGDRQRFTLAHELGHLVLEGLLPNDIDEEKAANRFSGAFLLPKYSLKKELGDYRNFIETQELNLLKQEYGISMQGAFMRAHQTGIIDKKVYQTLWRVFKKRGWTKKEPGKHYPSEEPHIFQQLIFHALAEEFIGESKAAELMDMSVHDFYKLRRMSN